MGVSGNGIDAAFIDLRALEERCLIDDDGGVVCSESKGLLSLISSL